MCGNVLFYISLEHKGSDSNETDKENEEDEDKEFDDEEKHFNPDGVTEAPHKIQ